MPKKEKTPEEREASRVQKIDHRVGLAVEQLHKMGELQFRNQEELDEAMGDVQRAMGATRSRISRKLKKSGAETDTMEGTSTRPARVKSLLADG